MATEAQQKDFISKIAPLMVNEAKNYGYNCVSAAIAQACLESGYGLSSLSAKYHNYFGIKCGSQWMGASVNMRTMEEYTVGIISSVNSNFRAYKDMKEGVKGYYEFLKYRRYAKVKEQMNPNDYLVVIKSAGYATSSQYVKNNMNVVNRHNLEEWDKYLRGNIVVFPNIVTIGETKPKYVVGQTYETTVELNVRTDAGKWNRKKSYDELTVNAQLHDKNMNGALDKGTRVTCREVRSDGEDIWIRIPSGWVAAYYHGNIYIA